MAFLFPRPSFVPGFGRFGPALTRSNDFAPVFSLFDESLSELHRREGEKTFNPRFDVREGKDVYEVEAEVPGIDQKDISIEFVDEHTLTVRGRSERRTESSNGVSGAIEAQTKPAIAEAGTETDTASEQSHHATVEDEVAPEAQATNTPSLSSEVATTTPATEKSPAKPSGLKYWISERRIGTFTRSFRFDARINQEAVKASLKDGILSVSIPKAPAPESRRVQIE